jgi:hypothetical protein
LTFDTRSIVDNITNIIIGTSSHHIRFEHNKFINTLCGLGATVDQWSDRHHIDVIDNIFDSTENTSKAGTGIGCYGIYFRGVDDSIIRGNTFFGGRAYGLAIRNAPDANPPNTSRGVIVDGNSIFNFGRGGIHIEGTDVLVKNNLIYNNGTDEAIAGIFRSNGDKNQTARFYNNTIFGNKGNCIWNNGNAPAISKNNICWQNTSNTIRGDGGTSSYNLFTDPKFVNAAAKDFRLQSSSPAINAGTSFPEVTHDFDCNKRPAGGAYDIGVYEHDGTKDANCSGGGGTTGGGTTGSTSGGTTGATTGDASLVPCHTLSPGSTIYPNFAAPWNVLASSQELLIKPLCPSSGTTGTATVDIGNGSNLQYIYKIGYKWNASISQWQPITLSGSTLVSNSWYIGSARMSLPNLTLTNQTYIVAYVCTWMDNTWKCGCRDAACSATANPKTGNLWNLQGIKR